MIRRLSVCTRDCEAIDTLVSVHAPNTKLALDCTWGKGSMWEGYSPLYKRIRLDIDSYGSPDLLADYLHLPFLPNTFDLIVWDPPHLEDVGSSSIMATYNRHAGGNIESASPAFVASARGVLKPGGLLLMKIADSVHGNKYQW